MSINRCQGPILGFRFRNFAPILADNTTSTREMHLSKTDVEDAMLAGAASPPPNASTVRTRSLQPPVDRADTAATNDQR
jgi:hypothetical protein